MQANVFACSVVSENLGDLSNIRLFISSSQQHRIPSAYLAFLQQCWLTGSLWMEDHTAHWSAKPVVTLPLETNRGLSESLHLEDPPPNHSHTVLAMLMEKHPDQGEDVSIHRTAP